MGECSLSRESVVWISLGERRIRGLDLGALGKWSGESGFRGRRRSF